MARPGTARLGQAWPGSAGQGEAGFFLFKELGMKFDIDVRVLEPGTTVEQSECESIVGIKRTGNEYAYQFALMQLGDFIQKSLWRLGKHLTVRTTNGEVQVLTHEEASKYNESRFDLAIDKMRRCNRRLNAVDVGELGKEAREDHSKAIIRQSRILTMLKTVRRDITPEEPRKVVKVLKR